MIMSKVCTLCKVDKMLENYYKDSNLKSGYRGACKECVSKYDSQRNIIRKNREYDEETSRKCLDCQETKDISEYMKNYKSKNGYHHICKACYSKKRREQEKKPRIHKSDFKYNRPRINEHKKNRYHSDPDYRLTQCIRARLRHALKSIPKKSSTFGLLGCSIEYFKLWIEYQFEDWMTWENYGLWQLDHVLPCASFNLSQEEDQYKCFNWTNYQPLHKFTNNSKNNKILDEMINAQIEKVQYFLSSNISPKGGEASETRKSSLNMRYILPIWNQ